MAVREERNIWELLGVGKDGEVSAKPAGDSETNAEAFLAAIRSSDIRKIQRIIEKGNDINAKLLPDGSTPLHLACREGFHDVVDYLIVKGADINIRDSAGKTALQYQAQAANSTLAANGSLQASEEQPEGAVDEVSNQLKASRCNGQESIANKRTAESSTTSSLPQDTRPSLAASSTPNLMKLHSLKQALSTTQSKRKREGKDHSFSSSKRIPGQNGVHSYGDSARSTTRWSPEAKRISSKDLSAFKHMGEDDRHSRTVAQYTPTPISTLNGSKAKETETTVLDDLVGEMPSSPMTVTLPGSIINAVSKVNGNSTIRSSRTPENDERKSMMVRHESKVGYRDPRITSREGRLAGVHVTKDPRLASRKVVSPLLKTASESSSIKSSAAVSNYERVKPVTEESPPGFQPKKVAEEKVSESSVNDTGKLASQQNSHGVRRHLKVYSSRRSKEKRDALDSKQDARSMAEEIARDLLHIIPLSETKASAVTLQSSESVRSVRTLKDNSGDTSDEENLRRPPPLLHKSILTGMPSDVDAESHDIPPTMTSGTEYGMETHRKSLAKSEAAENDNMSDLTTPLQIRIPKPREAILQRHALPPELSPQGDSHLLQTCTGDDNGPLDLSLKRNGSTASHGQSTGSSKIRNTLQPPVLSPKPIPPIPSALEMASLRTRSSPALLSPDIARSPVPIMQDSPLSETARHSPNTVMYNPLTLPIARGLSGRPEQPQILPPLPRSEKMSHPGVTPIGASTAHGIPMATVVPSVVRNWGGYTQNGNGVSEGAPTSNVFMRPSASDMMGLLASASVLTRRTPTLEQLLKTPSMVNKSQSAPILSTAAAPSASVTTAIHPMMATSVQSTATVSSPPMTISKHLAEATLVRPIETSSQHATHTVTSAFTHAVQPLKSSSQTTGLLNVQANTMPSLQAALPFDKEPVVHGASTLMKAYSTFEHAPAKTATQVLTCQQGSPDRSLSHDRPGTVRSTKREVQLEGLASRNSDVKISSSPSKVHESSKLTVPVSSQHPVLVVPPMVVDSGSSPSERNIWSKLMPLGPPANSPRNIANSPRDAREQEVAEILSNMSTPLGSPAPPPMESPSPSPHPSTPPREGRVLLGEGEPKHVGAFPCLESMLQKPPLSLSDNTPEAPKMSTPTRTLCAMQQSQVKTRFSPPAKIRISPDSKVRTSVPAKLRPGTDSKTEQEVSHMTESPNRANEPVCGEKQPMPTIKTEPTEAKAGKEQANVSPMRLSRSPHSRPPSTCIRTTPANIAAILSMKSNISPQRALYPLVPSNTNATTNSVSTSGLPFTNLGFSLSKMGQLNSSSGIGPNTPSPAFTSSTPSSATGVSQPLDSNVKYSHSQTSTLPERRPSVEGKVVSQCTDEDMTQSRDFDKMSKKEEKLDIHRSATDLPTTEAVSVASSLDVSVASPSNQSANSPPAPVREPSDRSESVTSTPEAIVVLDTTTTTNGSTKKLRKFTKLSNRARRREDRLKEMASKSQRTPEKLPKEKTKGPRGLTVIKRTSEQDDKDCQQDMSDYSTDNRRDSESSAFSDAADINMGGLQRRRYGRRSGPLSPRQEREFRRLKDSEGFVRDKKPPKTMNLYEDTSLLGREQRYLQRAMMRFQEMELADKGLPVEAVVRKTPSAKPVGVAGTRGRGGRFVSSRPPCVTVQHHGPDQPAKPGHPRGRRRGMWQRGVERPRKRKRTVSRSSECSNTPEAASCSNLTNDARNTTTQQQKTAAHSSSTISRTTGAKEDPELFRPEMIYSRKNHLVVRKPGFQDFYPTILPTRTRGVAAANFSKYARKAGQNGTTASKKMEAHRRARRHWARKAAAAETDDDPEKSGFVDLNNLKVRINLKDLYRSNMAQQRKKLLKKCCSSTANAKVIPEQIEAQLSPKIKIQKCLVTEGPSSKGRYFARRTGGHPAFTYKVTSCNMSPSPVPECTADIPKEEAQEVRKRPGRKRGPPKALREDVVNLSTKPGGKRKYKSRHLEPEEEAIPTPARAAEEEIPAVDMELIHIKQEPLSDEETVEYDQPEDVEEEQEEEEAVPHPDLPPMPPEMKKLLIQKSSGETVLHRASRLGYEEVVRYCLETRYVDVNSQDNAGYSPLHEACVRGHMAIVQDLILFGGDVNCSAQDGTRPIHDAVENDHVEIVRMLLSYGADPCLATYSGRTISSLCRSDVMERFITEHFRDLAGREENDSNEGTWDFSGSCVIMEDRSEGNGMDVFADIPKEEESDLDDLEFEISERPHLPSYNLLIDLREGCRNYLLVDDVITQLEISRDQLMTKLANQAPVCVSKSSFLSQISESQVTEIPSGLVACSGSEEQSRNSPPLSASDSTSPGAVQEKDQEVPGGTSFAKSFPFGERKVPDQAHAVENNSSSPSCDVKTKLDSETTLESYDYDVNLEREGERNLSDTLLAIGDLREDARHTGDCRTTVVQEPNRERQDAVQLDIERENVAEGYSFMESAATIQEAKREDQKSFVFVNGSSQSLSQLCKQTEEYTEPEENQTLSTKGGIAGCEIQTPRSEGSLDTGEKMVDRTGETYIAAENEKSTVDQNTNFQEDQDHEDSSCSKTEGSLENDGVLAEDIESIDKGQRRTEELMYEENHETSSTCGSSSGTQTNMTDVTDNTDNDTRHASNSPPLSDIAGSSSNGHNQSPISFGAENSNVWQDTNSSNQSNDVLIGQSGHEPAGSQSELSVDSDRANLLVKLGANEDAARTESAVTKYADGMVCSFETASRKTEESIVELLELTSGLKELLGILTEKL
ncbi:uncharacterized protein LOC144883759 isoform X2 [Branchiostoma floridae x Branchiostoma japonicum]